MKYLSLLLFLLVFQFAFPQKREPSEILYDRGNTAVARKDYRTADSLFTLSLNLSPHPDSYYNRAVCRRQLNNFEGYCLDLFSASRYGDTESKNLYWKQCAKADTIYKKENSEPASKKDYEFSEYITSYKYNTDFEYEKRDTAKNIILSKIRKGSDVIYRDSREVSAPLYNNGMDSLASYIKTTTKFSELVQQNDLAGVAFISLLIDEAGTVKNSKVSFGDNDVAIDELLRALLNTSNWIPAMYNNRSVKYQADLFVTYYDKELSIFLRSFSSNNPNDLFTVVEEMPQYPGGPMEMMRHIQKNIVYPQMAKEAGLSGKCFLKFVVLPNGKISNIQLLKGVKGCAECNREAMRVIQIMPTWKPGKQNGNAVSCFYNLPINFQLR